MGVGNRTREILDACNDKHCSNLHMITAIIVGPCFNTAGDRNQLPPLVSLLVAIESV